MQVFEMYVDEPDVISGRRKEYIFWTQNASCCCMLFRAGIL